MPGKVLAFNPKIKELRAAVDETYDLNEEIKELKSKLDLLKEYLKDSARLNGNRVLRGHTAVAKFRSHSKTIIDNDEFCNLIEARNLSDFLPEMIKVRVPEARKILGTAAWKQITKTEKKSHGVILLNLKK